ncbi:MULTISPECIES: glycosyltransferase family 4 protein [Clostridium]|uniref:Glycogen synthase n=2 Tax=Clostridium TaxID=1485 RepID=A0A151ALL7_9CLOT|nr:MULTISPECIES: glycosyltransferase family 4 protein [Clostridium]KYH28528.1 glycogen synthase [Clostridium colicanis DSM 13634]MBE6042820.1 glycosyltransferase family 4 protein [Clostridium thermopalmarium]PRR69833.1 Glycogen synthase [Clostridium thermopalmarium DSM 5974]PVZ21602.1 glycosyltransferase involved in cell wall biosynthesis [Clostridium thermopalmarium DSM 5974]
MRILILSWEYPPKNVGGLSNHVYHLSHSLCEMGHEVHVVTCQDGIAPIKENDNGVFIYRVEPYKIQTQDFIKWVMQLNFAMIEESIRIIKLQGRMDIIHAHDWLSTFAAKALKWAYNIPLIATIHATEYGRNAGIKTDMQRYISSTEWNLTYEAWKVIVCSNYMKEQIATIFSTPREKIWIIPNGVKVVNFQEKNDLYNVRKKYAKNDEKIVLYIGRHVFEKGIHILINAIPEILKENAKIKFIIAGTGSMTEELKDIVLNEGIEEKVIFTGYISEEEKGKLYRISDAAVFPSIYEPFGIVALEAMAAGCPVIASDIGGFSEIIRHGINGLKFMSGSTTSLKDSLLEVLNNTELANKLRENGLKSVKENYSWKQIAELTTEVYKQVLKEAKGTEWAG